MLRNVIDERLAAVVVVHARLPTLISLRESECSAILFRYPRLFIFIALWSRTTPCAGLSPVARFLPEAKASEEGVGILANSATGRHLFQFLDVASPKDHVVRMESIDKSGHAVRHMASPFPLPESLQSPQPNVIFVGPILVREVPEPHGHQNAPLNNKGGTETRSQAQKEQHPAFVAPESLHGRIVDNFHGASECRFEIKPHPSAS